MLSLSWGFEIQLECSRGDSLDVATAGRKGNFSICRSKAASKTTNGTVKQRMSASNFNWDSHIEVASISDVGMRRATNQDSYCVNLASSLARWQEIGHLFLVADGMGAHAAGELASQIASEKIPHLYTKYGEVSAPEALRQAVVDTNAIIYRRGQANEDFYNMGTTCSVLTLLPQGAVVAHVGDSRVYRLRGDSLEQLTFDHSLVWEMRASGNLSPEDEEANLVPKNVITRSLGPYPEVKVDLEGPFPVQVGDSFLICSDGLTGQVADDELGSLLANLAPAEAARVLVDLSNLRGGPDNITIVIVKVVSANMATSRSSATRIEVGTRKETAIHPLTWALLAASLLITIVFLLVEPNFVTLAIPGAVALGSLIWMIVQSAGSMSQTVSLVGGQRFGKGPYRKANCDAGGSLTAQLEKITSELQVAAREEKWGIDWDTMTQLVQQATESVSHGDEKMAIRSYARSISYLMDQLRKHSSNKKKSGSADS